ncbi:hypothetical protein J7L02_01870 [Candidatus Woesearchaeota archaeon]|nr:hypothetical protein [Candidatus Woesearchaeota archaeon]
MQMKNMKRASYFLVSLSNRENLGLCKKYALAGFTNSINGVWTFSELNEGDYLSFLYGARAHNLYQVVKKEAIENAVNIGPWKPVTFKMSGKTYYFPFRLWLKPIRKFNEPIVRNEFSYVAENLLLRGGYRKTHFQADQTTLQNVSQMGSLYKEGVEKLNVRYSTFVPKFTRKRSEVSNPKIFLFQEIILQSLIRQKLTNIKDMKRFLDMIDVNSLNPKELEILGEKALPEGHIDLLIKESVPIGLSRNIVIEVKLNKATEKDFEQLLFYIKEFGEECLKGVLIAKDFSKKSVKRYLQVSPIIYALNNFDNPKSFLELLNSLKLEKFE